jgi:hypothetical protein
VDGDRVHKKWQLYHFISGSVSSSASLHIIWCTFVAWMVLPECGISYLNVRSTFC